MRTSRSMSSRSISWRRCVPTPMRPLPTTMVMQDVPGGGVRPGITHGSTDDFCYNVAEHPVHVHDLNATLLHLLGIDHTRLTYKFQGRHFRLTDVHGTVVAPLLA